MRQLPHTASCFVCGESNASGLNLRFETDGKVVTTRFTPGPEHTGFKGVIHGGITATLLDEIMVWACAVPTGRFGFCAELNVRYLHPLRPGVEVLVTAELVTNQRNKLFLAKGEVRDLSGKILATATGKYLAIKESEMPKVLEEFIGDASGIFQPPAK